MNLKVYLFVCATLRLTYRESSSAYNYCGLPALPIECSPQFLSYSLLPIYRSE